MTNMFQGAADLFQDFAGVATGNFTANRRAGTIVSLGDGPNKFVFFDTEAPQSLPLGGTQVLALHQFYGGARTIDTFGDQPRPLEFSGVMLTLEDKELTLKDGPYKQKQTTAVQRMRQLLELYLSGAELNFYFDLWKFKVVISEFLPDVKHENRVDYTIKLHILEDDTHALLPDKQRNYVLNNPMSNILQQVTAALKMAQKVARLLLLAHAATQAIIQNIQKDPAAVLWAGAALIPGSALAVSLHAEMIRAGDYVVSVNKVNAQTLADIDAMAPIETLEPTAITGVVIPQLEKTVAELDVLLGILANSYSKFGTADPFLLALVYSTGYKYQATLKRLGLSLAQIVRPSKVRTIRLQNPNLYRLASVYYGTPEKWKIIADANQLSTPKPVGEYELRIPYDDFTFGATAGSPTV
jgi:hypothetical protein